MILTITPNPSIDRTIAVPGFSAGATHQGHLVGAVCAGKGVNVSRTLAALGTPSAATGLVGERQLDRYASSLAADGIESSFVPVSGEVRVSTTILDPSTEAETHIRERGPAVLSADIDALAETIQKRATSGSWVVACGSLPEGLTAERYSELLTLARERGARIAIDSSGRGLQAVRLAKPDLIKPNSHELAELCGRPIGSRREAFLAARELVSSSCCSAVLLTLGADGAMLVSNESEFAMRCKPEGIVSAVGAGDAALAGFLWSNVNWDSPSGQLHAAVAAGAASLSESVAGRLDPDRFRRLLKEVEVLPLE